MKNQIMQLKISSPTKVVFEGEIKEISLPTEIGDISIFPWHKAMVTTLKPWIIKFIPKQKIIDKNFLLFKNMILISISKWMAFVDGKIVRIVTAIVTTQPKESKKDLEIKKSKTEKQISKLRKTGSLEEIEKSLNLLEKINADLKLKKLHS